MAVNLKELSKFPERLCGGHRLCSGCGASIAVRQILLGTQDPVVVACATGCLEVATTVYPYTAWEVPFIHNAFENAAATISGVETAYCSLKKQGKIKKDIKFIAFGGDGGTYDIGLQSLSGALERGHNFIYVCLPPDVELIMQSGKSITIGELAEQFIKEDAKNRKLILTVSKNYAVYPQTAVIEEGIWSVAAKGSVLSWDGNKGMFSNIIKVQKKKSPSKLVEIITASGSKLSLTPEHNVLIDTQDGPRYIAASDLKPKDEVYAPRKIDLSLPNNLYIFNYLEETISINIKEDYKAGITKKLTEKYGSLKNACENLNIKYWELKEKARPTPIGVLRKVEKDVNLNISELFTNISYAHKLDKNCKDIAEKVDSNIAYLLGLISSDGYIKKQRYGVTFINENLYLLQMFKSICTEKFPTRAQTETKQAGVNYINICSPILYSLAKNLNVKSDPKDIAFSSEEIIVSFLRGYFDGDGCCSIIRHEHSKEARIILTSIEPHLMKRLHFMLKRLGIASSLISRKHRFDITIFSQSDVKRFIEIVGTNHPGKKKIMQEGLALIESRTPRGKYFSLAPRICARMIKQICKKHNIKITTLDKKCNISTAATGTRRTSKHLIKKYIEKFKSLIVHDSLLEELEGLTSDAFFLDPIKEVNVIPSVHEYVYDITVDKTHNFIPEATFVISNCYDNEGYMNTGSQRSSATPCGASTTTAPAGEESYGKIQHRKDLTAICAAHKIPYAAQGSISHWNDLITKAQKAFLVKGPAFLNVLSVCHRGWFIPQETSVDIAKLAVETGFWNLYEIENGEKYTVNYKPKTRKPVTEFLKPQGRFKHLFKPTENMQVLKQIQDMVDHDWNLLLKKEEFSKSL